MGDPKKTRKKYSTPSHPWKRERLEKEKPLKADYGLKNKKEIYIMDSFLKNIKSQIKLLSSQDSAQATKEREQILAKLRRMNLLDESGTMDTILGLDIKNVMERRLQSLVYKKGLANSIKQARQYIVHEHIIVGNKKITSPSYLVTRAEEASITFSPSSSLSSEDHPERAVQKKAIKKELEKTVKKIVAKPVDEDLDMPEIPEPTKEVVISDVDAQEIEKAVKEE